MRIYYTLPSLLVFFTDLAFSERAVLKLGECVNSEDWTIFMSRDNSPGSGEYELLSHLQSDENYQNLVCSNPTAIEVRKINETDFSEIDYYSVFRLDGERSGYYCKNEEHPQNSCDDVEVRYCCEPLPLCVQNDENCEVCDENDENLCYEYKSSYVAQKIDEHFGYLGNRESCTLCNKCVVSDDGVITAHYEQGSTTPSNSAAGDPEGGCQWRVRFNETFEEMWLEYEVLFENDFDFVKGGKMPGLQGKDVNSGCNLPDGTNRMIKIIKKAYF